MRRSALDQVRALLARPAGLLLCVGGALILLAPSLGVGLLLDDHLQRAMVVGPAHFPELARAPWDLYAFVLDDPAWHAAVRARGMLPWFASPTMHATFFRPLASLTLWLDATLWPDSASLRHAHNLLWYGVLIVAVWRAYQRVIATPWVAGLATLLYAIDDARGLAVGWAANRNAVIASALALLALEQHLSWRQDRHLGAGIAAPVLFALGLLGGETAVGVLGYVLAAAVFLESGSLRSRAAGLLPMALVLGAWHATYRALGYGVAGSGMYTDPVADPGRYLVGLLERVPVLLAGQLTPLSPQLNFITPPAATLGVALLACSLLGVLIPGLWRLVRIDAIARFSLGGLLVSTLPVAATLPHDRLLLMPGFGGAALVAVLLAALADREPALVASRAARGVGAFFAVTHLGLAPALLPVQALAPEVVVRAHQAAARSLDAAGPLSGRTLVIVSGPDFFMTSWLDVLRFTEHRASPARVRVLSTGLAELRARAVDSHTLDLRSEGGFATSPFDALIRDPDAPYTVGERHDLGDVVIEIVAVSTAGVPTGLRCRFARRLDDPDYVYVVWSTDGYRRMPVPRLGAEVLFPATTALDALAFGLRAR